MTPDRYAALSPNQLDIVADRVDAARAAEQESSRTSRGLRAVASDG
jgi:hypothetical protein